MHASLAPTTPPARLGDRRLFPDLEPRAYLNHGAISPPSLPVRHAALAVLDDYARRGVGAFLEWHAQRARLRAKLAALVAARADDVALIPNTTRGITDVALCFPWRTGDRVILFEGEFPANVTPWQRAADLFGLHTQRLSLADYAADPPSGLERLAAELARGVRLVAVSAVQFQTGLRMPIGEMAALCHAHGAEIFVDAVQAVGAVPLDVTRSGIDYLACGSHKWLMGLEGAGFLYVRPERVGAMRPHVAGWLSHEDGLGFLFDGAGHLRYDRPIRKRADFVEGGNYNAVGLAALEASVDLISSLGVETIYRHVNSYLDGLEDGLRTRGFHSLRASDPARRSCTLGVLPPRGHASVTLQASLTARGISCSVPDGVLRFTPHWPNALEEIPTVLAAVDEALRDTG